MSTRRLAAPVAAALVMIGMGIAMSAEDEAVCVRNAYEVPWVHPGITFYLNQGDYDCAGLELPLVKEGETRCFEGDAAPNDGWMLSGLDAASGACVPICEITRQTTRIVFSTSRTYACTD